MQEIRLTCTFQSFDSEYDLPAADRELLNEALRATGKAYAPYSQFHVGAALRLKSGKIVKGNNQENVAYPSGLCAERVALFFASANWPDDHVEALAITAKTNNFEITDPVTPCGSCRQVMAETEKKQGKKIRIIMKGEKDKVYVTESAACLLPLMFKADELKKRQ